LMKKPLGGLAPGYSYSGFAIAAKTRMRRGWGTRSYTISEDALARTLPG
jgi:hypothetical protein